MSARRIYVTVALCGAVVYFGALWNRFAMDDAHIILFNPSLQKPHALWQLFAQPYWPPDFGGKMYRPLAVATYALDRVVGGAPWWFHAVNLAWHAGATMAVAAVARHLAGGVAALVGGLLFALHPVHVEAVANVVGRAELMAALFACLSVYAALWRQRVAWSAVALAAGLLSKENAAVAPGLIVWAWMLGVARPARRLRLAFLVSWIALGAAYLVLRGHALHPYARLRATAPALVGETPLAVRLTGTAALSDVTRLLLFPLELRADYSPRERTPVRRPLDPRLALGLACFTVWGTLLLTAWRRRWLPETFGLGWIAIAYLPVANLLFPIGVVVAERTLYLPSAGLALAVGAAVQRAGVSRRLRILLAALGVAAAARTALRVPVWRDDWSVTLSILEDSPASYRGPGRMGPLYQGRHQPEKALRAFEIAIDIFDRDAGVFVAAADAALTLGRPQVADSLLLRAERVCFRCVGLYRAQARAARERGDPAVADSLLARARRLSPP